MATYNGGGMYNANGANVLMEQCRFENNNAQKGGAVFNLESSPEFNSVDFESNGARYAGGAMIDRKREGHTRSNGNKVEGTNKGDEEKPAERE